jgi:hypothetical protein
MRESDGGVTMLQNSAANVAPAQREFDFFPMVDRSLAIWLELIGFPQPLIKVLRAWRNICFPLLGLLMRPAPRGALGTQVSEDGKHSVTYVYFGP